MAIEMDKAIAKNRALAVIILAIIIVIPYGGGISVSYTSSVIVSTLLRKQL
jgi:hypothetical protein